MVERRAAPRADRERDSREDQALRLLIHDRERIVDRLGPVLFGDRRRRAAYQLLVDAGSARAAVDAGADDDLAALIIRLANEDTAADPDDVVALLASAAADRVIGELLAEQRSSPDPSSYAASIAWLKQHTEALRDPATRQGAVEQLVPWLATHGEERIDA